jgi:hypothetical protein
MITRTVAWQPLEHSEMAETTGGLDELAPSLESGLWYDICWCAGRVAAGAVYLVTAQRPASDYAYAKIGYTN